LRIKKPQDRHSGSQTELKREETGRVCVVERIIIHIGIEIAPTTGRRHFELKALFAAIPRRCRHFNF